MEPYHYYGDIMRKLFVGAAVVMLLTLPFFSADYLIPAPLLISLAAIFMIVLLAGFISPGHKLVIAAHTIAAGFGMIVFEYYAVYAYVHLEGRFFAANQLLALIFFIAFYYSVKTFRGALPEK